MEGKHNNVESFVRGQISINMKGSKSLEYYTVTFTTTTFITR